MCEYERYCERFNSYVTKLRSNSKVLHPEKIHELSEIRLIPEETLESAGVFYIGAMEEMVLPDFVDSLPEFGVVSNTNNMVIFRERYVIPIYDSAGNILNLVGYSYLSDVRYVYGTAKYYRRGDDFYGLEGNSKVYESGWAVVVEGFTDRLALLGIGVDNVYAWCGTAASDDKIRQLSRLEHGVVFIHDRDKAGDITRKHWITPRCVRLNISNGCKDIDEFLHKREIDDNERLRRKAAVLDVLLDCKEWLLSSVLPLDIKNTSSVVTEAILC